MGVNLQVVDWLRRSGHEVVHLRDQGLQKLPDEAIFAKAFVESRIILTFDLDFGELAALSRGRSAAIVIFRLRNARTARVIERLTVVLADCATALERRAVVVVEEARHRIRHLPAWGPEAG
jgi:predicted nuclease of predicted toxin-antitoxin system